jgi:hypothetical protein
MREQWPLMASDMRREGKSPAEIELVRKQVFSSN